MLPIFQTPRANGAGVARLSGVRWVVSSPDAEFLKQLAEQLLKIAMDCVDGKSRDRIIMAANQCLDRIDPKRAPRPAN